MAFTPKQQHWIWYEDDAVEPVSSIAPEILKMISRANRIFRLRLTIAETGGTGGSGAITLGYSYDNINFTAFGPAADWNYAPGKGTDGNTTTTYKTSDGTTHGLYHTTGTRSETWSASQILEMDIAATLVSNGPCGYVYYFQASIAGVAVPLNGGQFPPKAQMLLAGPSGGPSPTGGGSSYDEDPQNEWISSLRSPDLKGDNWATLGKRIVAPWGLQAEFDALLLKNRAEGASMEHSCKRALRDLQLEYDLEYDADAPTTIRTLDRFKDGDDVIPMTDEMTKEG